MALVVGAAAAGVASAGGAATVFNYNRDNFMVDRLQRMRKEFMERRMRIAQAKLWREDVRDFVSLTERKMKYYLLVNVLFLGFNVNLWCEGRLPEHTPRWLLMGNQIAIGGSFMFQLLCVWFAMHAAVAAQSYQARILTQLVRLPIPTWDEAEACRTYASDFERLEPRQQFRVPFISGWQERIARGSHAGSAAPVGPSQVSSQQSESANEAFAADPWGLERRGDDIYELGCQHSEEVAELRHIQIIRKASKYWLTYDAFARVSMSVGTNQLLLAMSYYMLGYCLVQVSAPIAAFAGVLCLVCMSEVIVRMDLTISPGEQRTILLLLLIGPCVSGFATYYWELQHVTSTGLRTAELLAPIAFLSNGAVIGLLTLMLRVRKMENGAMMPLAFRGVLYLDVFAWLRTEPPAPALDSPSPRKKEASPAQSGSEASVVQAAPVNARALRKAHIGGSALTADVNASLSERQAASDGSPQQERVRQSDKDSQETGYYALGYASSNKHDDESDNESTISNNATKVPRPALGAVAHSADGRPEPSRPDDLAPSGSCQDMRNMPGAPRAGDGHAVIEESEKDFFEPITFMPAASRKRHKVDGLFDTLDEFEARQSPRSSRFYESVESHVNSDIVTGHDFEVPGTVPWIIFRNTSILMCVVWTIAAVYSVLDAFHYVTLESELEHHSEHQWEWGEENSSGQESVEHGVGWGSFEGDAGEENPVPEEKVNQGDGTAPAGLMTHQQFDGSSATEKGNMHGNNLLGTGNASVNRSSRDDATVFHSWLASLFASSREIPMGDGGRSVSEPVDIVWPYGTISPRGFSCDASGRLFLATDGVSVFTAVLLGKGQQSTVVSHGLHDGYVLLPSRFEGVSLLQRDFRLSGEVSVAHVDNNVAPTGLSPALRFRRGEEGTSGLHGCASSLSGEMLQDIAVVCPASASTALSAKETLRCEALVLHRRGKRLATCWASLKEEKMLSSDEGLQVHDVSDVAVSSGWLWHTNDRHTNGASFAAQTSHREDERIQSIFSDPACSIGNDRDGFHGRATLLQRGCATVATSQGRIATLESSAKGDAAVPTDIEEEQREVSDDLESGSESESERLAESSRENANYEQKSPGALSQDGGIVRAFNSRYFGTLLPGQSSLRIFDSKQGGVFLGTLPLFNPAGTDDSPVSGFCVGGGHVYAVGEGSNPKVWRMAVPQELAPENQHV